jgi:hypothetical protein
MLTRAATTRVILFLTILESAALRDRDRDLEATLYWLVVASVTGGLKSLNSFGQWSKAVLSYSRLLRPFGC